MSVQAISWVLDHSPSKGTERLVLLSLANHAHDDGSHAWPAVATIGREANVSERSVQRALRALEEAGAILADGLAPDERLRRDRRPTMYRVLMPRGDAGVAPLEADGVTTTASRGDEGVTQTVIEPSIEPPNPPEGGGAAIERRVFDAWREATGHGSAKLNDLRRRKIKARLKEGYDAEDLVDAVRGIARSEFHMGENDRRQKYDDLTVALRDGAQLEKFANLERAGRGKPVDPDFWMTRNL